MAIYHFSVKMLSRSDGRDAVAAAAYRAGEKLKNEKTGETHDYTKKRNVISSQVIIPTGVEKKIKREELWNKTELAEKRKNSCLAREFEVALPAELTLEAQTKLAIDFAREIVEKYKIVADVAIHKPDRRGDERNVHAHILTTTRRINENGELGDKARELDDYKTRAAVVEKMRERWAEMVNAELERHGRSERVDHRTLAAQGIDRVPQIHVGVHATQMERRGLPTDRGETNRMRIAINKHIDGFKAKLMAEQEKAAAAAARAAAEEKAAEEKPKPAAQKSELDQQRRPDERPQPAAAATQAQIQPQPTAKHPASPTQKAAKGAKKAETAKTTPKPQDGAKKAVIDAEQVKQPVKEIDVYHVFNGVLMGECCICLDSTPIIGPFENRDKAEIYMRECADDVRAVAAGYRQGQKLQEPKEYYTQDEIQAARRILSNVEKKYKSRLYRLYDYIAGKLSIELNDLNIKIKEQEKKEPKIKIFGYQKRYDSWWEELKGLEYKKTRIEWKIKDLTVTWRVFGVSKYDDIQKRIRLYAQKACPREKRITEWDWEENQREVKRKSQEREKERQQKRQEQRENEGNER